MALVVVRPTARKEKVLATLASVAVVCVVGLIMQNGLWPFGSDKELLHMQAEAHN